MMNQQCKVCGEPAAGFHFGAFTCEGCKSFFGRSYNNLSSISECKNGGECVINKKNRTACKACRLRKCLLVGMSKSGSRYGRRSNWFKIHCLLQEQQQQQQQQHQHQHQHQQQQQHHHHQQQQHQQQQQQQQQQPQQQAQQLQHHQYPQHNLRHQHHHQRNKRHESQHQYHRTSPTTNRRTGQQQNNKEDTLVQGLDDYKNSTSPSASSPDSHKSDSSVEISERRAAYGLHPGFRPFHPAHLHPHGDLSALSKEIMSLPLGFHLGGMPLVPPAFLPPPSLTMFSPYHRLYGVGPHTSTIHSATLADRPNVPSRMSPIGSSNNGTTNGFDPCSRIHDTSNNNNNNNNRNARNQNVEIAEATCGNVSPALISLERCDKRFYLDAILKSQQAASGRSAASDGERSGGDSTRSSPDLEDSLPQDNPIDLSMKVDQSGGEDEESDEDRDAENDRRSDLEGPPLKRRPIDLTTRS